MESYFSEFLITPNQRTGKRLSPSYVNQHRRSVQQFYRWLDSEDLIEKNPFTAMKQPRIPDSPVPVFTDAELSRLFMVTLGKSSTARRDRAILRVLLDTGFRVGELCGLEIDDVDFSEKTLVVTGKGRHSRRVPFNAKCYAELHRWLITRPDTGETLIPGMSAATGPPKTATARVQASRRTRTK